VENTNHVALENTNHVTVENTNHVALENTNHVALGNTNYVALENTNHVALENTSGSCLPCCQALANESNDALQHTKQHTQRKGTSARAKKHWPYNSRPTKQHGKVQSHD
jgi:hypothetical protein